MVKSSRPEVFCKKGGLKNFTKFYSLFFNKVAGLGLACNFNKEETVALVFSCEFCKNFKNTFVYRASLGVASERPLAISSKKTYHTCLKIS